MNYEIRSSDENVRKLINSPRLANFKIFNEHMIGLEMRKQKTVLNRPIAIGFSILEWSKNCMYSFHYELMKPT